MAQPIKRREYKSMKLPDPIRAAFEGALVKG
jgi:hypothetical protein